MKNPGFSLIEFVVYLGLFSFVALLFFGVASRAQLRFMQNTNKQEYLLRQELAVDLMRRDLMSASVLPSELSLDAGIFKKLTLTPKNKPKSVDIMWFIGNQGLMRAQGQYDFEKQVWINRSACIVCKTIKQISFVLQKGEPQEDTSNNGVCRGVWVIYKYANSVTGNVLQENKFFVKFRNGVVT